MDLKERIESFSSLGQILRDSLEGRPGRFTSQLEQLIYKQQQNNPWFTPENTRMAVRSVAAELTYEKLTMWTNAYPALNLDYNPVNIGVIMAGNIPLVGFHDFLSVLISGNNIIAKTSSKDPDLILFIRAILCNLNPRFSGKIKFTNSSISGFDMIIATGSDNTSRYFDYYFSKYPNIIRRNRNSVAVLEGIESETEINALGKDIFSYFGLGCRNVSKIYIPEKFDFSLFVKNWAGYSDLVRHQKYANNYDFNKAVYIVNRENFFDTGFLLLKESEALSSPVAVLYYEYFRSKDELNQKLASLDQKIQCIAGKNNIPFGMVQSPSLWDYADGIDTIELILKKNSAGIL